MSSKPVLIHLQNSASQSILWLLEELGVDYELRSYLRPKGRGAEELKQTHRQGKSPQLLIPDGAGVLTQSSAIALYLIRKYDTAHRFHREDHDPVREEQLVCIGISDTAAKAGSKLMFSGVAALSPFFLRPILRSVSNTVGRLALDPDIEAALDVLEAELGDRAWFMDDEAPSRADFILRFQVDLLVQSKCANLDKYPKLKAWTDRCLARDAWKRAIEKGNGYDLNFPAQL